MTIEFRCSQCNQLLRVPDTAVGKNARCPKCQALMLVPAAITGGETMGKTEDPPSASFSHLPTANGGFDIPPQPPMEPGTPTNPFAEGSFGKPNTQQPSINPYAPSAAIVPTHPMLMPIGQRSGLPWEIYGAAFSSWWQTTKLVMTQPTLAFSMMRQTGGLGSPLLYAIWGNGVGLAANIVWLVPSSLIMGAVNPQGRNEMALSMGFQFGFQVAIALFIPTLFLFFAAAIWHLSLKIVRGANFPFETTYRVLAFSNGSFPWLNIIPIVGPLVAAIWIIAVNIIGIANAHQCDVGRAVGAFVVTIILSFCICGMFYLGIVAVVLAIVGAAGGFR